MVDALMFGHKAIREICDMQNELVSKANRPKADYQPAPDNPFAAQVREEGYNKLKEARQNPKKQERSAAAKAAKEEIVSRIFNGATSLDDGRTLEQFNAAWSSLDKRVCRDLILEGKRLDGRGMNDLREIDSEVGIIPRVHGSALFTRGETQSVATIALGTVRDRQRVDGLFEELAKPFMLDYNFPSYSVGEVRPIRGPGRREIGHGALAERSLAPVLPTAEAFPYTIRLISDITESNGSSSMASVCSGTLSLMDAGVPITQPVAGISIGLVKDDGRYELLTDIMGDEDHFGDMDFKVAGSQKGITGIQLDLKIDGINEEIIRKTLDQARVARLEILKKMLTTIRRPRSEVAVSAPKIYTTKIDPEKIGLVIGPGGKNVRAIQEEGGVQVDIEEDGRITVSGQSAEACENAIARIEAMTEEIKVGRVYLGTVASIKDFGAFIEIAPGKDGLCHISELADGFVKSVNDVCKVGDKIEVKVIAVDEQNRVKLSRKAVLAANKPEGADADDDEDQDDDE